MHGGMDYSVDTSLQLRQVIRALRKIKGLNQAQAGQLIGVSQMRIAQIEADPIRPSFEQVSRLVAALDARVKIVVPDHLEKKPVPATSSNVRYKIRKKTKEQLLQEEMEKADW